MNVIEAFGIVLKKYRKLNGLSQEQLAFKSDLDRTYIGLLERAERQPSITTIFKIAKQLNIPPQELIKEVDELIK